MAPTNRWSPSAPQGFVVGMFIVAGGFILACGVGMTNIAIGGLGVAIAVLAPLLIAMTGMRRNAQDYVYGTAHVHEVSPLPKTGMVGRCELELLIDARGIHGVPVRVRDPAVPVSKWPDVGATLPVRVASREPRQVQVLWEEVRTHREVEYEDDLYPQYTPSPDRDYVEPIGDTTQDATDYDRDPYPPTGDEPNDDNPTLTNLPPIVPNSRRPRPYPSRDPEPEPAVTVGSRSGAPAKRVASAGTATASAPSAPSAQSAAGPYRAESMERESMEREPMEREFIVIRGPRRAEPPDDTESPEPADDAAYTEPANDARYEDATYEDAKYADAKDEDARYRGAKDDDARYSDAKPTAASGSAARSKPAAGAGAGLTAAAGAGLTAAARPVGARSTATEAPSGQPPVGTGVSITLIVSDLERSLEFYRETLGLREIDNGPSTAVLAFGDARVILRHVADMPPIDRRLVHLNLDVPDVQEAYDRMRAKGVEFVHRPRVVQQGEHLALHAATFRDPDGHAIALTRWAVRR